MEKKRKKKIIVISLFVIIMIIFCIVIVFALKSDNKTEVEIGGQNIAIVNNGDGLYKDDYIKGRYIYRGSNPNNYITFNGELWRIVSVDKDGNIQIIRNDILINMPFDSKGRRDASSKNDGGNYCSDAIDGCNAWTINKEIVGEPNKYVNGRFSGKVKMNSEILEYLNSIDLNKSDMINHHFYIGGVLYEDSMSEEVKKEMTIKWNGKIALISLSDYLKASTMEDCDSLKKTDNNYYNCRKYNWMYLKDKTWWTLTPIDNESTYLWYIGDDGFVNNDAASRFFGVRPVIYLSDHILLTGDGTLDSPYILKS